MNCTTDHEYLSKPKGRPFLMTKTVQYFQQHSKPGTPSIQLLTETHDADFTDS